MYSIKRSPQFLLCLTLLTISISLKAQPVAELIPMTWDTFCPGPAVLVAYDVSTSSDSLIVYWGDSQSDTFSLNPSWFMHDYDDALMGEIIITLVAFDDVPVTTDSTRDTIYIHTFVPGMFRDSMSSTCITQEGVYVSYTDTSLVDINPGFHWDWGDGSPNDYTQHADHVYTQPGTYVIQHSAVVSTWFTLCGDVLRDTITITADETLADFTWTEGCPCNDISFTAAGTADLWFWDFADGDSSDLKDPAHSFPGPRRYTVALTGIDTVTGCIFTKKKTVEVCEAEIDSVISKSNNHWYFGGNAALEFNSGSPVVLMDNAMWAGEGVATVSDHETGDLLFYTNGSTVYSNDHSTMVNGTGLLGHNSAAQSALIIPDPADVDRYYLFTANGTTSSGLGYYWNLIEMSLNGGLGEIITKNQPLFNGPCVATRTGNVDHETMAGTIKKQADCASPAAYWMVHPRCRDSVGAVMVTEFGLSPPVVSWFPQYTGAGKAVFSKDGTKFAMANGSFGSPDEIIVADFDLETGVFSHFIIIRSSANNVAFSPNNELLYTSAGFQLSWLAQYDLLDMNPNRTPIGLGDPALPKSVSCMYMGPDDKIYCGDNGSPLMGVVNFPDVQGLGANYVPEAIDLLGNYSKLALQNIVPLSCPERDTLPVTADFDALMGPCPANEAGFSDLSSTPAPPDPCAFYTTNPSLGHIWDFGDGDSSYVQDPNHAYAIPGNYPVTLIVYRERNCGADTLTKIVDVACVLPIELISFEAKLNALNQVELKWEVAEAKNISHFEMARSEGGADFRKWAKVHPENLERKFDSIDMEPLPGESFYRLKTVEQDGQWQYSEVRKIKLRGDSKVPVFFPNPARDKLWIVGGNQEAYTLQLRIAILDLLGNLLLEYSENEIQPGNPIDISTLDSGLYLVHLSLNGQNQRGKLRVVKG